MKPSLLLAVLLCALGAPGCRKEPPAEGVTVLLESPPDSLDDRFALTANGQRLAALITPGLLTFDDASRPVPVLAESFREVSPRCWSSRCARGSPFMTAAR